MRERLDKLIEQLKALNERLGKRNKILLLVILLILGFTIFMVVRMGSNVGYEVLYTGLSEEEQVEILGQIQSLGVETKSTDDGEIDVPEGQADSVRAQLAVQGYPKSGMSYDVFTENVSMTSTEFEKETYKIYELQDRLASTIKYFDGVRDSTVTIAQSQGSDYVLQPSAASEDVTTASVTVIMKDGGSPTAEQVSGIKQLVASSVPGMQSANVTVIDGNGVEVKGKDEENEEAGAASTLTELKAQLEKNAEQAIKAKVLNLLEPVYGDDRVRVAVNCTVDVDKTIREAITYYPSEEGSNSGVKNNETLEWENIGTGAAARGVVGTESNSEVPTYPYTADNGDGNYYSDKRAFSYLVSQLTEQVESNDGDISDTNVSVVIDSGNLTQNEIDEVRSLVATTAGISAADSAAKVSIMDTRFASAEEETIVQSTLDRILALGPLLILIAAGAVLLLLLLIIGIIMARRKKKREKEQIALLEPEEDEATLTGSPDIPEGESLEFDLGEMAETREQLLKEQIREFAEQNPEIAASLIKNWLKNEEN
ncbi:MAG: flagellar M-ring protein FliF [Clostridia bacterium]|nr:flagellar M-ring protein FliF [Clostridia bacterium]